MRHVLAPEWVIRDYQFPSDVQVSKGDDLADVPLEVIADADFVVMPYLGSSISQAEAVSRMQKVSVLQLLTAGFDDMYRLTPAGVTLCNAAGVHDASTSEMAVLLTLAALRGLADSVEGQRQGTWVYHLDRSLADKKVLLVGYGRVGKATEARLLPFECEVIKVASIARDDIHGMAELPSLIPDADVIILTMPLNDSSRGLVDAKFLGLMKDEALLVNVARGAVVKTDDLVAELRTGRISAALDVTDPEPLPDGHPLWAAPNCLISPHLGGDSDAFPPRAKARIRRQLDLWLAGEPLECIVKQP